MGSERHRVSDLAREPPGGGHTRVRLAMPLLGRGAGSVSSGDETLFPGPLNQPLCKSASRWGGPRPGLPLCPHALPVPPEGSGTQPCHRSPPLQAQPPSAPADREEGSDPLPEGSQGSSQIGGRVSQHGHPDGGDRPGGRGGGSAPPPQVPRTEGAQVDSRGPRRGQGHRDRFPAPGRCLPIILHVASAIKFFN